MCAWALLIVVWKDDIYEKRRLYSFELMQVVLLDSHTVYIFQTILLKYMNLLSIEIFLYTGVNLGLHFTLDHKVDD